MFISSIGIESLLGGGVDLALALGNASSVLVEVSGTTGQSAKKTWPLESTTYWILSH